MGRRADAAAAGPRSPPGLVDRGAACRVPWSVVCRPAWLLRFRWPRCFKTARPRTFGRAPSSPSMVCCGGCANSHHSHDSHHDSHHHSHHHSIPPQPVPQSPVPREVLDPSDRSFVTYSWNFFIREITSGNEHKKYSIRASENSAAALQKNTFHRTNSQRDRPTESDALRPDHVLPSERLATAAG